MKLEFAIRTIILNLLGLLAFGTALVATSGFMEVILHLGQANKGHIEPVAFFAFLPFTESIQGPVGSGILLALIVLGLLFFNLALLRSRRLYWLLAVVTICLGIFVSLWRRFSGILYMVES